VDAVATKLDARPLRADARRNQDRILAAAQRAFSEHGPHLPLDEIAKQAGVSPATLFRHFANRDELVAAVIERRFAEEVEPVIAAALDRDDDAWGGMLDVIAAILRMHTSSDAWRETVTYSREAGLMLEVSRERLYGPFGELLDRAKAAGLVRADIDVDDLKPILRMLRSLVTTGSDLPDDAWRRYFSLMVRTGDVTTSSKRSVEK
jgi:AcrR family transcriptional regulator